MRRYWNRFLNWLIPNRRQKILIKMIKADEKLGLYGQHTPVRQLFDKLWDTQKDKLTWYAILNEALEKEKETICQVYIDGFTVHYDKEDFDPYNDIGYKAWSEYYFKDKFI